jgi:hypothetical protein
MCLHSRLTEACKTGGAHPTYNCSLYYIAERCQNVFSDTQNVFHLPPTLSHIVRGL